MNLKSCAHCGGIAKVYYITDNEIKAIYCGDCPEKIEDDSLRSAQLIEAWNTRHYPTCGTCRWYLYKSKSCWNEKSWAFYINFKEHPIDGKVDYCRHWTPKEE
jgi:hypothetical protein